MAPVYKKNSKKVHVPFKKGSFKKRSDKKGPLPQNKYKTFLDKPIQILDDAHTDVNSLIRLSKKTQKLTSPLTVKATKFDKFVKTISNPVNKKLLLAIPIILFRLSTLLIRNKDIFHTIFKSWHSTWNPDDPAEANTWGELPLISKISKIFTDYFNLLFKKSSVLGIAEIIILTGIILDDIPRILVNNDYIKLEDLAVTELAKQLARTTKEVHVVYEAPLKEAERAKEKKDAEDRQKNLNILNDNILQMRTDLVEYKYTLKTALKNELGPLEFKATVAPDLNILKSEIPGSSGIGSEARKLASLKIDRIKPLGPGHKGWEMYNNLYEKPFRGEVKKSSKNSSSKSEPSYSREKSPSPYKFNNVFPNGINFVKSQKKSPPKKQRSSL